MIILAACALYFAYKYYDAKLCVKRLKEQSTYISNESARRLNKFKIQPNEAQIH